MEPGKVISLRALVPFLLLIVPILEIAVFILVGGQIGIMATLGMILLTAIIGTILLRQQGFQIISRVRQKLDTNQLPGKELASGAMILVAGVLLLTPGFVTDAIGFLLFVPFVQSAIWNAISTNISFVSPGTQSEHTPRYSGDDIVDLDESEFSEKSDPNSPWQDKSTPPPRLKP